MKRDFLRLLDLSTAEIEAIWKRALAYKKGEVARKPLQDLNVGLVFEKPSTRTRISFEVAVLRSGGHPLFVNARDTQMTRNEPLKDTARVLSRYLDGLVVRTFSQKTLDELAAQARIPVVNALSDLYHPAQILSDLFTVWEKKKTLDHLKIAWIGDG
ncbi:MAG: ornithine carbamoyltransferase, partial [Desulfobacterota bacterium]|nr:ornithine carbamoyltransferase [Thermodesulfobacteriota bacterium]